MNTGDTAWLLASSALVLLMTPGLAFFYGGLVRQKNVLSVLMQCLMVICLVTVLWVVAGYSLAFGPDVKGIIGNLDWAFLKNVSVEPNADYAATVPHQAFMVFQLMFAIITPALIIGAFAERKKFVAFCVFSVLWSILVYSPIAHWVWAVGGFLRTSGVLDFAGGTVVHINAGMAALAAALVIGKRKDHLKPSSPHNLPIAVLGAGLLWFGWFGFNSGSALAASGLAASAFVTTHVAAASAGAAWTILDWVMMKKPTVFGMITGIVAGLVAITPAAGFVTPLSAIAIGVGASICSYLAIVVIKRKLKLDDTLDVFGVHGISGIWGALATGIFASKLVNSAGADGLLYGNSAQVWIQLKSVIITGLYSFAVSYLLLLLVKATIGLRVSEQEEEEGLDASLHGEIAYPHH